MRRLTSLNAMTLKCGVTLTSPGEDEDERDKVDNKKDENGILPSGTHVVRNDHWQTDSCKVCRACTPTKLNISAYISYQLT